MCMLIRLSVRHAFTKHSTLKVALVATFLIAVNAHSACVVPAIVTPIDEQLARLPDCQRSVPFLTQLGQLLNARGRYFEALDHLERALLLDPNLPQAQLDYAIALAGSGDLLSARLLLDSILAQNDLPPELRRTLLQARQRLANPGGLVAAGKADAAGNLLAVGFSASLRQGRDSNLLGTPSISSLELTFPGDVVVVQLADSNAPRAGSYTRADAKLELSHQTPGAGRWELAASHMVRTSPAVPEANTRQSELVIEYSQPIGQRNGQKNGHSSGPWGGYLGTSLVNITTDGGTHYASQGLVTGLQWAQQTTPSTPMPLPTPVRNTCSARAGLEWQNRDLSSNPILSSSYAGSSAHWACSVTGGGQWQISAKSGLDRPRDPERPGGEQAVASLRGITLWPLSSLQLAGSVLVEAEVSTSRDSTGYSPLLDNAAVRSSRRVTTRLEYQRALGARLLGTLGAEWSTQHSNLALFRVQSWGSYAALRLAW